MSKKLKLDSLSSELSQLQALIDAMGNTPSLSKMSLESRRDEVAAELQKIDGRIGHHGEIALVFDGGPVIGSRAINADFAANALTKFQGIVGGVLEGMERASNVVFSKDDKDKKEHERLFDPSSLCITNVVHGSFGFVIEEVDQNALPMFDTPIKEALVKSADLIEVAAGIDDATFEAAMDDIDSKLFFALKSFIDIVRKNEAFIKIYEDDREMKFDKFAIERAYERVQKSEIDEIPMSVRGRLLGVLPNQKKFEFQPDDSVAVIKGKAGPRLTEAYLRTLDQDENMAGKDWIATMTKKIIRHGGTEKASYILDWLDDVHQTNRGE